SDVCSSDLELSTIEASYPQACGQAAATPPNRACDGISEIVASWTAFLRVDRTGPALTHHVCACQVAELSTATANSRVWPEPAAVNVSAAVGECQRRTYWGWRDVLWSQLPRPGPANSCRH